MTTATPRTTPCENWIYLLPWNVATVSICSVRQSVLKRAQAKYEMKAFNSKGRYEKLAFVVHVL